MMNAWTRLVSFCRLGVGIEFVVKDTGKQGLWNGSQVSDSIWVGNGKNNSGVKGAGLSREGVWF